MVDGEGQTGTRRVACAVCATEYDDAPDAHRIRRCPSCGSRLIRQGDGRLGAVATAAPPPKPPTHPERRRLSFGTAYVFPRAIAIAAIVIGAAFLVASNESLMDLADGKLPGPFPILKIICGIAAIAGGICSLYVRGRESNVSLAKGGRSCFACAYPLPKNHTGRCPECGKLQNRGDPRIGICPGCRRLLRGFYGDECPECGADVRSVTDGCQPDEPLPD